MSYKQSLCGGALSVILRFAVAYLKIPKGDAQKLMFFIHRANVIMSWRGVAQLPDCDKNIGG